MSNRNLLIAVAAVAALICLCTADVSHINHKPPQDVLVPFNDLLPPPLEEPSTTEATTAAAAASTTTPATKPTKKSYYQQLAKSKDAHHYHIEEKASAKSQPAIQLALDLLPPFAEAPEQPQIEDVHTTTHQPLVSSRPTPTATTKKSVPLVAKPQPIPQRQFVPQPQPQQQPHPQQLHARVSRPNSIAHSAAASSIVPVKSSISSDLITQYLTNFQFTTRRPSRGALPTLTPFPNHIKK
ncbi:uncharacterized protein LOC117575030 [Drosophila albomicans]|uniref:Uncharacterized protein LOC117575030 n=1 Tax=Drosophila albomicans TaxID=7291 RepID=A0A6P8XUI3_DROAB|nr:uncharacterized protein LOC117575030 [Drosophila albomicans]